VYSGWDVSTGDNFFGVPRIVLSVRSFIVEKIMATITVNSMATFECWAGM
jgi:hypothetical protein